MPLDARFSAGAEAELLLVGAEQTYVVDAISGELKEQRPPVAAALLPPAVGDLDGDGQVEWVFAMADGQVEIGSQAVELGEFARCAPGPRAIWTAMACWKWFCSRAVERYTPCEPMDCAKPTFPLPCRALPRSGDLVFEPVLCDVDADGKQEIFVAGHSGIFGVDDDGRFLPGFPLLMAAPPTGSPVVLDLDGDGRLALSGLGWCGRVCVVGSAEGGGAIRRRAGPLAAGWVPMWPDRGTALVAGRLVVEPEAALLGRVYCYPNPVGPGEAAHLRFALSAAGRIELEVFDALGGRVEQHRSNGLEAR